MVSDENVLRVWTVGLEFIDDMGDSSRKNGLGWEDLNGERQISTRLIPTEREDQNPRYVRVVKYESDRFLVIGYIGDGENAHHHCYLVESNGEDRYSGRLFYH